MKIDEMRRTMDKKYIEREAALEEANGLPFICLTEQECVGMQRAQAIIAKRIEALPAADVAPVVYGKWCHETDDEWCGGGKTMCSACGYGFSDGAYHEVSEFNFCPACGAKMNG